MFPKEKLAPQVRIRLNSFQWRGRSQKKLPKWECYHCGYITEEGKSPEECPACHAALAFWLEAPELSVAKEVRDLLQKVPIFKGLEERRMADVAKAFREAAFDEGTRIVKEGEQSVSFSILTEGEAEVRSGNRVIATLRPYEFFGELAALGTHSARTADVTATAPCKCLVAIQPEFQRILSTYPTVAGNVLGEVRRRYQPKG